MFCAEGRGRSHWEDVTSPQGKRNIQREHRENISDSASSAISISIPPSSIYTSTSKPQPYLRLDPALPSLPVARLDRDNQRKAITMAPLPSTSTAVQSLHDFSQRMPHIPSLSTFSTATTRSIPARVADVFKRQTTSAIIPTGYGNINHSQSPGTIAGIVLGSVFGFLLILYLIYTCTFFSLLSIPS